MTGITLFARTAVFRDREVITVHVNNVVSSVIFFAGLVKNVLHQTDDRNLAAILIDILLGLLNFFAIPNSVDVVRLLAITRLATD